MKDTTLVLLFNSKNQILLCMKKRWFWAWLWNWAGGKLQDWETITEAAIRELEEETTISLEEKDLQSRWILHFFFEDNSNWDQDVHIFTGYYNWDFEETEEMKPAWWNLEDIPYSEMWEDDKIWLPRILNKEQEVEYEFIFKADGKMWEYKLIK